MREEKQNVKLFISRKVSQLNRLAIPNRQALQAHGIVIAKRAANGCAMAVALMDLSGIVDEMEAFRDCAMVALWARQVYFYT